MRAAAAVLVTAGALVLAGCSTAMPVTLPATAEPAASASPATSPAAAAPGGVPDTATLVSCLRGGVPGAEVAEIDTPPGGTAAVAVDVARPDLPKRINRITVIAFPSKADADGFRSGAGAFVSGTGGSAETVGPAVVMSTFAGDAAAVAAAKTCVAGS
ncbi:hypothetical protein [Pseudonocardia sp. TRM90224]|uniref:hypothetical protein n=1 Tax=Pseudonocardia sp. TRM90224 TaxID=2812678 RepID=UPI001E6179DC|nr:hypothetical protein [Pseudonocardia sp. TRM90224]